MKNKSSFFPYLLFAFFITNHVYGQIIAIKETKVQDFYCPTVAKDTIGTIFIHGRVVSKQNPKTGMARAVIQLKGNDVYAATDSLGYYWLNINAEAAKSFTVQCSFVNHATKEVAIKHKLIKTTVINFELELNGGIVAPASENKHPNKKKQKTNKSKR